MSIEEQLNSLRDLHQGVRRRIRGEISKLVLADVCDESDITISSELFKLLNTNFMLFSFKNKRDNKNYVFKLPIHTYPFKPPKLEINGREYLSNHRFINEDFSKKLKKYSGINCFCCDTILCGNNWSPKYTILDVLNEVQLYSNVSREVVHRIMVDVIRRKYLNDDINIIQWLY